MARMTKADREAESLLIEFDKIKAEKRSVEKEYSRLQALVEKLPTRQFGGWVKLYGSPRVITDMDGVRAVFEEIGREVPTTETKAPLIVKEVRA